MEGKKHVYILGAGFSASLGGPLFTQLLTSELQWQWQKLDLTEQWRGIIDSLHIESTRPTAKRPVDYALQKQCNAEELLEELEWATLNASKRAKAILRQAINPAIAKDDVAYFEANLNRVLKRVIASECQGFLEDVSQNQSDGLHTSGGSATCRMTTRSSHSITTRR